MYSLAALFHSLRHVLYFLYFRKIVFGFMQSIILYLSWHLPFHLGFSGLQASGIFFLWNSSFNFFMRIPSAVVLTIKQRCCRKSPSTHAEFEFMNKCKLASVGCQAAVLLSLNTFKKTCLYLWKDFVSIRLFYPQTDVLNGN